MSMSSGLKVLVAVALTSSPTISAAQACQGARCVLPLQAPAAPPLPPIASTPAPVEVLPVEPIARRGIGLLPILLGAAALAGLLFLLLSNDNEDEDDLERPTSP